jgi:hypothetical protein
MSRVAPALKLLPTQTTRAHLLGHAIRSVLRRTYRKLEPPQS